MSDEWETFCDVGYYHMWRLRLKTERGWNDGFHINTRAEAEGLCELLNKLERERDEALSDLEFRRDLFKLQEQQLNDVRAERDRLAEALREIAEGSPWGRRNAIWIAEQALAAVKGGSHE
jgi:hypothetical protein